MSEQYNCEFCGKIFSSKSNLTAHKNKAKYCISKRAVPVPPSYHKCSFCGKCFTTRQVHLSHESKCASKDLSEQIIKYEWKILLLENTVKEKENTIKEKEIIINEKQKTIESKDVFIENLQKQVNYLQEQLATVALVGANKTAKITTNNNTTNTTNNNITQVLIPFNFDDDDIMSIVKHTFDEHAFLNAQKGVANLCYEYIIKAPDGKMRLVCTDPTRERFKYIDTDGTMKEDFKARNFISKIYPPIHIVGREIYEKTIQKCNILKDKIDKGEDKTDKYLVSIREEAADKAWNEIRMLKNEDGNKKLRQELAMSANV
jgi:hypothetical protein